VIVSRSAEPNRLATAAAWLTPRRLRAQALVLAICLWGVCAIEYGNPGVFDRAGNIKFQDFLQFPISARLIAEGRVNELYNDQVLGDGIRAIIGRETNVYLQYFYGPQVALPFVPLLRFDFLTQAEIWGAFSLLLYFMCIYFLWRVCPRLRPHAGLVFLCAAAYPPLFHFFVRGQLSVVVLLCFTVACLAFLAQREWLSGIALGCLAFKPQFLVAVPVVLLLAGAWKVLAGLFFSAGTQLALTHLYFGPAVMRQYVDMLLHSASRPGTTELTFSPTLMHSLYSFWELLIPWPRGVWALYVLSSLAVIAITALIWRSSASLGVRFSALVLVSVLVNPHLYIYDLLALVPLFLLVTDWVLDGANHKSSPMLLVFLYASFVLPLLGPLSRWIHVQLSVPFFAVLLWMLWRMSVNSAATVGHTLASPDSHVV
jgi:alpha-1,2-mannosyltransferase